MSAHFENGEKCDGSKIWTSVHTIPANAVFKMCRLEFRFQNLPSSKSAGKKCAVFVWTGGLSVMFFTVFKMCRQKMCRFRVNERPIRHIFHRFQNVPASCECSLSCTSWQTAAPPAPYISLPLLSPCPLYLPVPPLSTSLARIATTFLIFDFPYRFRWNERFLRRIPSKLRDYAAVPPSQPEALRRHARPNGSQPVQPAWAWTGSASSPSVHRQCPTCCWQGGTSQTRHHCHHERLQDMSQ